MKMNLVAFFLMLLLVMGTVISSWAQSDSHITPGGPWVTDTQEVKLDGFKNYEELIKTLEHIEKTSKGQVELEVIGQSNQGRDNIVRNIVLAKVGNGSLPVMIMAQQHGNEIHGSGAALKVIKLLSSGSQRAKNILEELTILIIARVNPDGHEFNQRVNDDPTAPPRKTSQGFYTREGGWDINRFHYLDWTKSLVYNCCSGDYPANPVPEAQAVVSAYLNYQPIWVLDVHNQLTYRTDEGMNVTGSMLWPTNETVSAEAEELSKQMVVIMMDHMRDFGYSEVTLYPSNDDYSGIARNAYGIAGSGSVLVEIKGQDEIGQKQKGMLVRHITEMIMSLLEATADGSLFNADDERVEELPERGDRFSKDLPANDHE